ncbi:protein-associating with the carboxyl-terminal domain of ezrin [Brachyhypopomus gauderio]|uniref:protein-associating with the carboxyl-terminal domain of ezrin n=1 Tax=Brachyhypopomus gauderio TaxID=698409 RepID=UPI004041FD34
MGTESSALRGRVLEEPLLTLPSGLRMYSALLQDGKSASVFVYKQGNGDKVNKAAKHLKTLRHPSLLRFHSCCMQDGDIHLVTERVRPLGPLLDDLTPQEICSGIYDLLQALVFLHDRGTLSHNNVCMSSVFVSEDGHWKLGGMETVCKFNEATPEFLASVQAVRDSAAVPPEEQLDGFSTLPDRHAHARDAFSFGVLLGSLIPLLNGYVSEELAESLRCTLQASLLTSDPRDRLPLSRLLTHEFFRNDFLDIMNFLKSLTLKSEEEKNEFFKFLLDRVHSLPEELTGARLVPKLLNSLVLAEPTAVRSFLPHLLHPRKDPSERAGDEFLLSLPMYRRYVVPQLLKLFRGNEEHVRMVLLSHMHIYAEFFSHDELKSHILPQVLLGMRDTNDTLVAMTLQSLAVLVPLLGAQVVVGGERMKVFKRTTPNFTKSAEVTPETSPVHVIGAPVPHVSQPSKVFQFSKPFEGRELVLENLDCLQPVRDHDAVLRTATVQTGMSKMDGSLVKGEVRNGPPEEAWPDWGDADEMPNGDVSQPFHPSTQHEHGPSDPPPATAHGADEPWDDFEDSKVTLDQLPRTPVLAAKSSREPGEECGSTSGPGHERVSKALKLSSAGKPTPEEQNASWLTDCHQTVEDPKFTKPSSLTEPKPTGPRRGAAALGLGEEFTIKVKKRPYTDPELDFFADMVPDIKLSSPSMLFQSNGSLSNLAAGAVPSQRDAGHTPTSLDTLGLTARFAAVDLTEAEGEGWGDGEDISWEDENAW